MGREELYITVPSLFRCPISLDVMKSPVSLCTGVTYDRSSIQHWLESGHDTCPATNQPLPSKDFVPNLTLHRLINLWIHSSAFSSSSSPRRPAAGTSSPSSPLTLLPPVVSSCKIRELVAGIAREPQAAGVDEFEKIAQFTSYCEENRRFLANLPDSVEAILRVLVRKGGQIEVIESAVRVLDWILLENGVRERIHRLIVRSDYEKFFDSILSVLRNGRLGSKVQSARVLELIASNAESRRTIGEKEAILSALVHLLRTESDMLLADAVLSLLISLSVTRSIKAQLVQLGLVPILSRIISDPNTANPAAERAIKMVHLVSALAEGRIAISEDPTCAVAVLDRLMKVPRAAKEEGVAVLWGMCCAYRDGRVKERVGRANGVTKLLVVMQSEGDAGVVKRMCGDLVKVLRGVAMVDPSSSSGYGRLASLETKTTHIRPY
ncbi:hypothetical protein CDL15_Pgr027847 [Punica granatum]|uniref:U-box domain-containing protein n=1 Tax=Punica granatum TaxID=22663 RepID=A0A218XJW5_PUNGR|nr:hypothetical protein CDL15_Pgr027847 [Punica granatum]